MKIAHLNKLQYDMMIWQVDNFGNQESWKPLLGIVEEVGELSHAHLKEAQGIRTGEDHIADAKDAIGDILIYLMNYCNTRDFCLTDILEETWSKVKKRNWKDNKIDGNGQTKEA